MMWTFETSAPATSSRGRMTLAASSSVARNRTSPGGSVFLEPSGKSLPVVIHAATAQVASDFPRPGRPLKFVVLPSGMYPGQSHGIGFISILSARVHRIETFDLEGEGGLEIATTLSCEVGSDMMLFS